MGLGGSGEFAKDAVRRLPEPSDGVQALHLR